MTGLSLRGLDGGTVRIDSASIDKLEQGIGGPVLRAGDDGYEAACTLWNAMIDRKPALVARCASADQVAAAVAFARDERLLLSIRGAGHNIAGSALCDGGMTIDLSGMRAVEVDAAKRTVCVQPGATLGDVDAATAPHGLAVPVGVNSTTGIAGLTLGGGFG